MSPLYLSICLFHSYENGLFIPANSNQTSSTFETEPSSKILVPNWLC